MAWNVLQSAVTKEDKIDALDQCCPLRLLDMKWYQFVSNAEVWQRTS